MQAVRTASPHSLYIDLGRYNDGVYTVQNAEQSGTAAGGSGFVGVIMASLMCGGRSVPTVFSCGQADPSKYRRSHDIPTRSKPKHLCWLMCSNCVVWLVLNCVELVWLVRLVLFVCWLYVVCYICVGSFVFGLISLIPFCSVCFG